MATNGGSEIAKGYVRKDVLEARVWQQESGRCGVGWVKEEASESGR